MDGSPIVRAEPGRGVLLQNLGLFPWLTVERNMRFGADIMDRAKGKVGKKQGGREPTDARVEAYLNELGLSSARKRFPHQISGGMQARTAIGRLLVANPGVLLLDEPFGSLDALTRASLHKLLLHIIKQEEKTVVFITHDIDEAIVLADRICVFSPAPGTIVAELTVPFGREREYEDVVQSEVVVELRREALSHLRVE